MHPSRNTFEPLDPDRPYDAPMLSGLTNARLKTLLNDPKKIDELIAVHPIYIGLKDKREDMIMENRRVAEDNLSREQVLRKSIDRFSKSQDILVGLMREHEQLKRTYDTKKSEQSLEAILPVLQTSTVISQDLAEHIGQKFMAGGMGVEEFKDQFLEKSREAHIRRVKVEKLEHFMATGTFDGTTF